MSAVILVIHLILAIAIIGLVLLQRSEGGGLGMGTSGGLGSFATPQATATALTRVTWICAGCFFTTSLVLGVLAGQSTSRQSILDHLDNPPAAITAPADPTGANPDKTDSGKIQPPAPPPEPSAPTSE
jgi:preprotein translocase subunit SecG